MTKRVPSPYASGTMTKKRGRGPRYEPAARLHQVRALLDSPEGVTIYDVAERFEMNPRTALRYIQALQRAGEPLYQQVVGKRKVWRIMPTARRQTITLTTSQMVALFLSRRVFDFLAGTGFKEDLDEVFEKLEATLKRKDFAAVRNLDRKVFDVNEARHLYENRLEDVNDIMTALLREDRLRVTHEGVSGGRKTFVLDPYTLLVYKKGLYLAGFSHHHSEIRTFALDGFRDVDWLKGDHFEYPADYRPDQLTEGAFGLIRGELTHVRILFDPKVARYLQRRQVRKIRFHHLRHSTASLLLMKGADLAAVQKIMRHQDPRITTEVYGHLQTTYLKAQIERLSVGPEPADRSGGGRPSPATEEQHSRLAAGGASEPPSPADSPVPLRLAAPFTTHLLPDPQKGHAPSTRRGTAGKDPRGLRVVGARGFEPPTFRSRTERATRLRHAPKRGTHPMPN